MGKIISICLIALLVAGCAYEVPTAYFLWGQEMCKENNGLEYLEAYGAISPNAICSNGAKFTGWRKDYPDLMRASK